MVKLKVLTKDQRRMTFLWFVLGVFKAPLPAENQVQTIKEELNELVDKDGKEID